MRKEHRLSPSRLAIVSLGLVLYVFVLYAQALGFGFTLFDDHRVLLDQGHLFGEGPVSQRISAILFEAFPREEPLLVRDLTWLLDSVVFGFGNPFGYHLSNLIFHAGATVALFVFLHGFTRQWITALATAVVFAGLAVAVEPVAWIMGRKDILAGLFLFLMLACELRLHRADDPRGRLGWYLAGFLCVVLACLSKASALVFPGVLLLLKWCLLRVEPRNGEAQRRPLQGLLRPVLEVLPHLLIAALVYRWYRGVISEYGVLTNATAFEFPELWNVLFFVDPLVWLRYVGMVLVPGELSAQYLWDGLAAADQWPLRILALAVTLAAVVLAVTLVRKRPRAAFLFLSFSVLLLPYANLLFFGWWNANRYVYAAAPFLLATILLFAWPARRGRSGQTVAAAVVVMAVWNVVAGQRFLPAWRDGESLWRHEIGLSQATLRTHNNLISAYVSMALRAPPDERTAIAERGKAAAQRTLHRYAGENDEPVDPSTYGLVLTYYGLGLLQSLAGDDPQAQLRSFLQAHAIAPEHVGVNDALGGVYLQIALEAAPGEDRVRAARRALAHYGQALSGNAETARSRRSALRQRFRNAFPSLAERELTEHLGPMAVEGN